MRFNSFIYWAFLAVVVLVLWLLPTRARKGWLLATSCLFYASWHWPYLGLLVGSAALTHFGARWMLAGDKRARGRWLIAANLLLLALFKYLDWLLGNANAVLAAVHVEPRLPMLGWILPLGISFYLFELMSYVVDLMRGRERIHGFWDFQLYVAFFPHLIAGPILRAKELLPQFERTWRVHSDDILEGLRLIVGGLFVKIVLADGLAPEIDAAFARSPVGLRSADVWLMAAGFGLQVYFDFASYSRIAIGSARLCGLQLVENFNYPYSATSPVEFWNRWHMSLSRWIRDYLFMPLAGRSGTLKSLCRAALLSMILCGIWHGARWTFVLWGLYHGVLIASYHVLTRGRRRAPPRGMRALLAMLATFSLVSLGWIFFRSQTIKQAAALLGRALVPHRGHALSGTLYLHVVALVGAVMVAPLVERGWKRLLDPNRGASLGVGIRGVGEGIVMGVMVTLCLVYLHGQTAFIYFQF